MERRDNESTPDTVTIVEQIGGKGSIHLQKRTVEKKPDGTDIEVDIIYGIGDDVPREVYAQLRKS